MDLEKSEILSKEEQVEVFRHLNLALSLILGVGLATIFIGYKNLRPFITLVGAIISLFATLVMTILTRIELLRQLAKKKSPLIERITQLEASIEKARSTLLSMDNLRKGSSMTLDTRVSSNLNYLSLERLMETLEERINNIKNYLNSNSDDDISRAEELLNSDLTFKKKDSTHLLEHDMPNLPPETWMDSLSLLITKVNEEIRRLMPADPLSSIRKDE